MWKRTITNSFIVLGGAILSRLFIFLYNILIIRKLTVFEYANFALLNSILIWTLVFSHGDLYAAVSKYVSEKNTQGKFGEAWDYYKNGVIIVMALSLIGIFISILFSFSVKVNIFVQIAFFSSLIPLALLTINDGLFKGHEKFKFSALVDTCNGFSKFIILFLFLIIIGNLNLEKALIIFAIASLFPFLLSNTLTRLLNQKKYINEWKLNKSIINKLIPYSIWVCLTDLLNTGTFLFTNYVLAFFSSDDLAQFSVVILIYSIFQICFGSITTVLIPQVSRQVANGERINLLGFKELSFLTIITIVIVIIIYFFPYNREIIEYVFNKKFYNESYKYVAFLLLTLSLRIFSMINKGIVQGLNNPKAIAFSAFSTFLINSILLIPLYRLLGIWGVILSLNIAFIAEFIFNYMAAIRTLRDTIYGV